MNRLLKTLMILIPMSLVSLGFYLKTDDVGEEVLLRVIVENLKQLHYSPPELNDELAEKFESKPIVNSLGQPGELSGYTLSLWHTLDLVHAIYYANDIYLKESFDEVMIAHPVARSKKVYHVLLTGIKTEEELLALKNKYYKQGYARVREFEFKNPE